MNRRQALALFAAIPRAAIAQTSERAHQVAEWRTLIAAMQDFDDRWTEFVNDLIRTRGLKWDVKRAAEVEKYFRRMTSQPGWLSQKKN